MRVSREMMAWPIALGLLLAPASLLQSAALGAEAGSPQFFQIFAMGSAAEQNSIESVPELQKNADQGDSNAEYKLGLVYDVGVGARQDLPRQRCGIRKRPIKATWRPNSILDSCTRPVAVYRRIWCKPTCG